MNYLLMVELLWFIWIAQRNLKPWKAALIIVVPLFLLKKIIFIILSVNYSSWWENFGLNDLILVAIQFVASFSVLFVLARLEETIVKWMIVAAVGAIGVFVVLPGVI